MSRLLTLIATTAAIPAQTDPEFANYNTLEQRLILKCGGDKGKLLKLLRRVKGRDAYFAGSKHAITVVPGASSTCPPELTGETLVSDAPRLSGAYGQGIKQRGNELFVGETGAVGSIFQVGEVHYYTRADENSAWTRQSGFFSPTQSNAGVFGVAIDYDGARVAVGESGVNTVDVFTFTAGSETHEQQITPNLVDSQQSFGRSVAISGSHMLIGAPNADDTFTSEGNVEYWSESGGTWTFQQRIQRNGGPVGGEAWGQGIAMTDENNAYICYVNGSGELRIQHWTRSGSTWSFQTDFRAGDLTHPGATNYVTLDTDGANLIAGDQGYDVTTGTNNGVVLVFGTDGTVTSEIVGSTDEQIGSSVTINDTEAVVGYANDDTEATNAGKAEVWDICI